MCGALEECFQRRVSVVVSHLVTGVWRTVQDKKMMSMDTMEMEMDMDAGPSVPFKPQTPLEDPLPEGLDEHGFDNDLVVIGGGSGGLACAKAAADYYKIVTVFDYVKPSPQGTTWGLGGTCVNVGCIPKKLMHIGAMNGEAAVDAASFGWEGIGEGHHNWQKMVDNVQAHITSLNESYKVQLRQKFVTYINALAHFVDPHTVEYTIDGKTKRLTSRRFVIATGGRPRFPNIPGAREFGISSDDLFSMSKPPGKSCVVGASYVALECAGFINGLGHDVTVFMRSIPLRGFDQDCAGRIVDFMEATGTKFNRGAEPSRLEKDEHGQIRVFWNSKDGSEESEIFDTVFFAIGRDADTSGLGLEAAGVEASPRTGKFKVNEWEQTNVPHIFAIGDVLEGRMELTPVAIQAGKLLAGRLYNAQAQELMDYDLVPTTVFTPIEYGSCGLSEEDAKHRLGEDSVSVFRKIGTPLEWTIVEHRQKNAVYMKIVCDKSQNDKVVGFHVLAPNAGEITQGFALGLRLGATKKDFDRLVGIHPTTAELLTNLQADVDPNAGGCST